MLTVRPLGLNVAIDGFRLRVAVSSSLEGYAGRGGSFDFETGTMEGVVLVEQVVGGLSEVLNAGKLSTKCMGIN